MWVFLEFYSCCKAIHKIHSKVTYFLFKNTNISTKNSCIIHMPILRQSKDTQSADEFTYIVKLFIIIFYGARTKKRHRVIRCLRFSVRSRHTVGGLKGCLRKEVRPVRMRSVPPVLKVTVDGTEEDLPGRRAPSDGGLPGVPCRRNP